MLGYYDQNTFIDHICHKHYDCSECDSYFANMDDRAGHQRDENHCYCEIHNLAFTTIAGFDDHVDHDHDFACIDCDRSYKTDTALQQHLNSQGHAKRAAHNARSSVPSGKSQQRLAAFEECNLICVACDRDFAHLQALQQRRASVIHRPLATLSCPASKKCDVTFTSPSAMLQHLESGGCKGGMTREKLNALLHKHDTDRRLTFVSSPSQLGASTYSKPLLTFQPLSHIDQSRADKNLYTPSVSSSTTPTDTGGVIFTPNGSNRDSKNTNEWSFLGSAGIMTPSATTCITPTAASQYAATILYDGGQQKWPCNVPGCNKAFRKKHDLVAHIHSVAHAPKLFHCPTPRLNLANGQDVAGKGAVTKMFKTISGLAQHVEAGACDGGKSGIHELAELFEEKLSLAVGGKIKLLKFD
jgi:hypothetical protein